MRCVIGAVPWRGRAALIPDLGRPLWDDTGEVRLVGDWPRLMVRTVSGRDWYAGLVGWSGIDDGELARAGEDYVRTADVGAIASLGASCVTLVAANGRLTAMGDLAGQRPVFYTSTSAGLLLCSSARVLACLVGAKPSAAWLAARLLASDVHEAWASGSPFDGVQAVPPGTALVAAPDGCVLRERPSFARPHRDLHAGGLGLRAALTSSVERRARAAGAVSADLSGGLDSTSLTLLAARVAPLDALTLSVDAGSVDDPWFATVAAEANARIRQVVADVPRAVDPYSALTEAPPADEPYDDAPVSARLHWWSERVERLRGHLHLSGDGGDAVLVAPPIYLADLVRRRNLSRFLRHAYGWARLRHRPPSALIRASVRSARTDRRAAMAQFAAGLRAGRASLADDEWERIVAWTPAPPAAAWTTTYAHHLAADAVACAEEAADTALLAPGDRAAIAVLRGAGRVARLREEIWVNRGVELHAPYFDDDVVRACFAVAADVRTSPEEVKPLLRAAVLDELPPIVRGRRTKGDYTQLAYRGLKRHAEALRALFDGSRLAALGLVIDDRIRGEVERAKHGLPVRLGALDQLIGAELWLRSIADVGGVR